MKPKSYPVTPRIFAEVVKKDLCCGCGVCAGVCPKNALTITFNRYGEYNPVLTGDCVACGLCETVCPFLNGNPNEDEIGTELYGQVDKIQHRPETGYYLETYVGHAPDEKMHWDGASGGMVTWTLCELLRRGEIDHVITVSPNPDPEKLFKFVVVSTPEDVRACSKSAYYPVETSEVLQYVLQHEGRYAMVGLPCVCKAVRLAQRKSKMLRERITILLGLVCGKLPSSFLPNYLMRRAGVDPSICKRVSFREKEKGKPCNVYLFKAFDHEHELCAVSWHEGYSKAYMYEYFKLNSCTHCHDGFAECADVAFMDAWVAKYKSRENGCSFALTRNPAMKRLLGTVCKSVSVGEVISSQGAPVTRALRQGAPRLKLRIWRRGARASMCIVRTCGCKGHRVFDLLFMPFNTLGYGFHMVDKWLVRMK